MLTALIQEPKGPAHDVGNVLDNRKEGVDEVKSIWPLCCGLRNVLQR